MMSSPASSRLSCPLLVGQKIELIILGVVAQSLQDIEAFAAKEHAGLSMVELWIEMLAAVDHEQLSVATLWLRS